MLMDAERIKVIRERNVKKRKTNEANYSVSGETIYSSRAKAFDEIVEICDQALMAAKDRDDCRNFQFEMHSICKDMHAAIKAGDTDEMERCCNATLRVFSKIYKIERW